MIDRKIRKLISNDLHDHKVIILLGPRQSGKTTLLKTWFEDGQTLWLNGDDPDVRQLLSHKTASFYKNIIGTHKRLIIDEAQRIENIGLSLKLIHDHMDGIKVIATGSSSFELANSINEPLTGRKWEHFLFPISLGEMLVHHGLMEENRLLEHRMVYGYYPDVINNPGNEKRILEQLADSYLYKDILAWEDIKKPMKLESLLQALAFQLGNEVSYNELGQVTGLNNETVQRYIDLLEKAFIIFRLPSLSRNLRNELKKSKKVYFYDVGIRNAIIKNWNPINFRNDVGALWENFLILERMKHMKYVQMSANQFFWRTHAQQEIDYIEEHSGKLYAYEFKWNAKRKFKFSKSFLGAYPHAQVMGVSRENYTKFITLA